MKRINNQHQYSKSIYTSQTGTSLNQQANQFIDTHQSIYIINNKNKNTNLSQKSINQYQLISGKGKSETSSRQKIFSRRYETLTVCEQNKVKVGKKSKSFTNHQIYFPHNNFNKINQLQQQNRVKNNVIRMKNNKKQTNSKGLLSLGRQKLHVSMNCIGMTGQIRQNSTKKSVINNIKNNIRAITEQNNNKNDDQKDVVSFLSKLNIQKRNKIMQIYRPKTKQFQKSRRIKLIQCKQKQSQSQGKYEIKNKNKNQYKKQRQYQKSEMLDRQEMLGKQQITQSMKQRLNKDNNNKLKNQYIILQKGMINIRPALITHLVIDNNNIYKPITNLSHKQNNNKPIINQIQNITINQSINQYQHNPINNFNYKHNQSLNSINNYNNLNQSFKLLKQKQKQKQKQSIIKIALLNHSIHFKNNQPTSSTINQSSNNQNHHLNTTINNINPYSTPIFNLPKYTDFYDHYVNQKQLLYNNIQNNNYQSITNHKQINNNHHQIINHHQQNTKQHKQNIYNSPITQQVQNIINNCYSPIISSLKNNSITPKNIQQPIINANQTQFQEINIINQDLTNSIHMSHLKNQLLKSNRHTPKLKLFNQFFSDNSTLNKNNFKIIKINQGTYFGQSNTQNLPHGIGLIFYKSGKLFQGLFYNGYKQGQGFQIYPDGSIFLGNYSKNKKYGKGRFQWSNGQIYDGQWSYDKKHGSGQWIANNSISYVGQWKSNRIQGFGILIQGQQRYEGQFINFIKNGHGTYRYQNGQIYTGHFKSNRLNGQGQYFWPNGDHYKGDFLNNKRHGKGVLFLSQQDISYRGEFRNDKKCGLGQETYKQKMKYIGNFENDLKHGWGILKILALNEEETDQIVYQGYWINNQTIQMSQTPIDTFDMIQEDEGQYMKNEISKSNLKIQQIKKKVTQQCKNKKSLYKKRVPKKYVLQLNLRPKQSIALKGRSRYMRINNHYIQKSIQGSNLVINPKIEQKLSKSRSQQGKLLKNDTSNQSLSRHKGQCICEVDN